MSVDQNHNVGLAFLKSAEAHRDRAALTTEHLSMSYGQLRDITLCGALHLIRKGARQSDTVAIRSDDLVVILTTIFATALLGCRWIFGRADTLRDKRVQIDFLLETDAETLSPKGILVDASWARPPEGFDPSVGFQFPGYRDAEDVWMISQTSGTTGTPKLVALSQRIVGARNAANAVIFDRPGVAITSLFPNGAPAHLSRYTSALIHGGRIVDSADPAFWCREKVDLVVGSPVQLQEVLGSTALPSKLPKVHLSGGKVSDALAKNLLKSFENVASGYGSTEAHNTLSNDKTLAEDGSLRTKTVLRAALLEIVDEADSPLPAGKEGIVRIQNDYLALGYIDNPEAEAATFRGGWFYPGDLGMWTTDGTFVVTGRINDQFNLGGVKINAALLDFTLQNIPGIHDAICFLMPIEGKPDRLTAFLSLDPAFDPTELETQAKLALMRIGGRSAVPERLLFAERLPRNQNGKPDRRGCVALVEETKAARRSAVLPKT